MAIQAQDSKDAARCAINFPNPSIQSQSPNKTESSTDRVPVCTILASITPNQLNERGQCTSAHASVTRLCASCYCEHEAPRLTGTCGAMEPLSFGAFITKLEQLAKNRDRDALVAYRDDLVALANYAQEYLDPNGPRYLLTTEPTRYQHEAMALSSPTTPLSPKVPMDSTPPSSQALSNNNSSQTSPYKPPLDFVTVGSQSSQCPDSPSKKRRTVYNESQEQSQPTALRDYIEALDSKGTLPLGEVIGSFAPKYFTPNEPRTLFDAHPFQIACSYLRRRDGSPPIGLIETRQQGLVELVCIFLQDDWNNGIFFSYFRALLFTTIPILDCLEWRY